MFAQLVRQDRFGDPRTAFQVEEVDTPSPGPGEVLIAVMASGINYNNVFAAQGMPVDVIAQRQRGGDPNDFHLGGSDASGIVYAVGEGVERVAVGDDVIVHPGWWKDDDPWIVAGKDPMIAPSARIWGYDHDRNFGSFGQFAVAQEHQVLPKADHLTWEAAAASTLVGTTAQRMLFGWAGNTVQKDDIVLVWGGSGGLGSQAIQLVRQAGGIPVAVVSSADKGEYCVGLGAEGYIDRTEFDHWGIPPHWTDGPGPEGVDSAARAPSAASSGRSSARAGTPRSSSSIPARTRSRRRSSSASRAGWSSSARARPGTRRWSTSATTGCGRSVSRARTARTTSRRSPTTTSFAPVRSIRASAR